jgi:hypothetical protein
MFLANLSLKIQMVQGNCLLTIIKVKRSGRTVMSTKRSVLHLTTQCPGTYIVPDEYVYPMAYRLLGVLSDASAESHLR